MVVQHNLRAMNSNRMLSLTANVQSKSTEKLSSGYKINRAADDAAGLSISEKMRKQIRGLTQASLNAADGISAVQTAEGALNEVQDMLQRMNELAVKASNGTMSEDDRNYIQDEIDQLVTEIDRVAETTKFNETYLLKGTDSVTSTEAAVSMSATYITAVADNVAPITAGTTPTNWYAKGQTTTMSAADILAALELDANGNVVLKDGVEIYTTAAVAGEHGAQLQAKIVNDAAAQAIYKKDTNALMTAATGGTAVTEDQLENYFNQDGTYKGGLFAKKTDGTYVEVGAEKIASFVTVTKAKEAVTTTTPGGALEFKLHVGADSSDNNQIKVDIQAMDATSLGLRSDIVKDENGNVVKNEDGTDKMTLLVNGKDDVNARDAIDVIADALQRVSEQRSALGAVQNRLEHTIANLDNVVENTTAAESQIRDTDMATEMVKYSNNNILAQAGQAMLAQANQANQGVLSLLG